MTSDEYVGEVYAALRDAVDWRLRCAAQAPSDEQRDYWTTEAWKGALAHGEFVRRRSASVRRAAVARLRKNRA